MSKKIISIIKIALFTFSSLVFWGLLYTLLNTKNGVITHNVLSGLMLVLPVLILNFIFSGILIQTMRHQNQARADIEYLV